MESCLVTSDGVANEVRHGQAIRDPIACERRAVWSTELVAGSLKVSGNRGLGWAVVAQRVF